MLACSVTVAQMCELSLSVDIALSCSPSLTLSAPASNTYERIHFFTVRGIGFETQVTSNHISVLATYVCDIQISQRKFHIN